MQAREGEQVWDSDCAEEGEGVPQDQQEAVSVSDGGCDGDRAGH